MRFISRLFAAVLAVAHREKLCPRLKALQLLSEQVLVYAETEWTTPDLHILEGQEGVQVRLRQPDGRIDGVVFFSNGEYETFMIRHKMRYSVARFHRAA